MRNQTTRCALLLTLTVLACASRAQTGIRLLGTLPGSSGNTTPWAVSSDGSLIFGDFRTGFGGNGVFLWTVEDGMVGLASVEGTSDADVNACSPSGAYAAGSTGPYPGSGGGVGWVWSEALGSVAVGPGPGGTGTSRMNAVSDAGVAVGEAAVGFTPTGVNLFRAARWTEAGGLELLPLPTPADETEQSSALDILPDGRVLGRSASGLWLYSTAGGFELLTDEIEYLHSDPAGEVFGGSLRVGTRPDLGPDRRAALWTRDGGFELLPTFVPDQFSVLARMSDDQRVIFGGIEFERTFWFDKQPTEFYPYLANRGVDLDGWHILLTTNFSADGRVLTGIARLDGWASGRNEAFVLTIEPCPADASFDGLLTPEDFFAWASAYQTGHIRCDQNGDGLCTGADFFAWVVGYAQGCP